MARDIDRMTRAEKVATLKQAALGLLLLSTTYQKAADVTPLLSDLALDRVLSDILELEAASAAIAIRRKAEGYGS